MKKSKSNRKTPMKISPLHLGVIGLILLFLYLPSQLNQPEKISYSEFKARVANTAFDKVVITDNEIIGELPGQRDVSNPELTRRLRSVTTSRLMDDQELIKLLDSTGTNYEFKIINTGFRAFLFTWILPLGIMILIWSFMFRRLGGPGSEIMRFGKSRSRVKAEADLKTTFDDVAGQEEAKEELREIIEFLKDPKRFTRLGGKLPKGILLVGPPGTGKTLFARAVAGEAKVPFFNISGSDFVEMFVGVGAARVRDLFAEAKTKAPCIIFIDELDAVGKARGVGNMGGHDEREQTLNQLLVEMDGFDSKAGVIIVAATNRPEILDPALLRAGRFDRQVMVGQPDVRERQEILQLHAKNVKLSPKVNLETIARATPGMVGADLANVVNESALLAARKDRQQVEMADFEEAVERILTGLEKKKRVINKKEKEIVAYHEAGHAIIAVLRNQADKVHKISIIPRGIGALGYTLQLPTEDRYLMTRNELIARVDVLLGGRAAEHIIFEDISTGASDDLQRASHITRSMITQYGMGETLGPTTLERDRTPLLMDQGGFSAGKNFSDATAQLVDEEIKSMMRERMDHVKGLLNKHLALLKAVAEALLVKETLNDTEFQALVRAHDSQILPAPTIPV